MARVAVPLALVGLGTSGVVAFALPGSDATSAVPATATSAASADTVVREQPVSRDDVRTPSPTPVATTTSTAPSAPPTKEPAEKPRKRKSKPAEPSADDLAAAAAEPSRTLWATDDLNIRTDPDTDSKVVATVEPGTRLPATTTVRDGFRLVVFKGEGRWVTAKYVAKNKPKPAETSGVTNAPCGKGSSMESGLTPDAVLVHRSVCARYPQVSSFGGLRGGGGFHSSGQAVDCMISDSKVGWELARWVRANARKLGVSQVIYSQKIWTVQRGDEGWRSMPDRGSRTANHYDHVHVSVYGNRAA